jgi:transposase
LKERAVRMVFEVRAETGQKGGAVQRVAGQLGIGIESLRLWVNQAEVDGGHRPGTTTTECRQDPRARAAEPGAAPGQ